MQTPEQRSQPLATSDQAKQLFDEIGAVTTLRGQDGQWYELAGVMAPMDVAAHFPQSDPTSIGEVTSFRVAQNFDPSTGVPKTEGSVALVTFTREEQRDRNLSYVTQVDYSITTEEDGTYGIGRHVMSYETGPHKRAAGLLELMHFPVTPDMVQARQEEHKQRLAEERALGLHDVSEQEARQIIDFVADFNPSSDV